MPQEYFNLLVSACGVLGGWVLKTIWTAVTDLQRGEKTLADKVSSIEILVAGQYVRKDEFERLAERIFDKLDGISEKLNGKADK